VAPTTAKLKHDIDRGRGGDKIDVIDPAAAPLHAVAIYIGIVATIATAFGLALWLT
jgi:hypothetical protein